MQKINNMEKSGTKIKRLREDIGISQVQLGRLTGYTQTYISLIETNRVKPSRKCFVAFMNAFMKYGVKKFNDEMIYVSLSNGDFNDETTIDDMELIRWELNEGSQDYVIITKKKLSVEQYTAISKILDRKENYVEKKR